MKNNFSEAMAGRSDRQLAEILIRTRDEYQPEAIEAAQAEFDRRSLDVNTFFTTDDVVRFEKEKEPPAKEEQRLDTLYKVLAFLFPGYAAFLLRLFFTQILNMSVLSGFALPVIIVAQYAIFQRLKEKGYTRLSADYKLWTINGWIFFGSLFILIAVVAFILALRADAGI